MSKAKKNPHRGSRFEDFLDADGTLDDVNATATKRVLAWRIAQLMKSRTAPYLAAVPNRSVLRAFAFAASTSRSRGGAVVTSASSR